MFHPRSSADFSPGSGFDSVSWSSQLSSCSVCSACTHTVHMALAGYFIVFSFVTKPGQTLEFLLRGTIVPLNFLAGYYCSIVASTPQPTVYAFMITCIELVLIADVHFVKRSRRYPNTNYWRRDFCIKQTSESKRTS